MIHAFVKPIALARMTIDKSLLTYRANFGVPFTQIVYAWYIENAGPKILVDAGVNVDYLREKRGIPTERIQSLEAGLARIGVSCSDIDIVILTQLHSDHIGEGRKLENAKFVVQRAELEFSQKPHPTVAGQYPPEFLDRLRFETIDGEHEVSDCVTAFKTPGHTVGGQSVAVNTAKGAVVISGVCAIKENFYPPEHLRTALPVFPIGIFVDLFQMYDSLLQIKERADIIIANHDPEFLRVDRVP